MATAVTAAKSSGMFWKALTAGGVAFSIWDITSEAGRYRKGESFFNTDEERASLTIRNFEKICQQNPHAHEGCGELDAVKSTKSIIEPTTQSVNNEPQVEFSIVSFLSNNTMLVVVILFIIGYVFG